MALKGGCLRSAVLAGLLLAGCEDPGRSDRSASTATAPDSKPGAAPAECRRADALPESAPLQIAVVPMGSTHEFWKAIRAGAERAAAELTNVAVTWKGPIREGDRESQINIVENFINARVHGIALAPTDNVALAGPVRQAAAAGISVVIMDSPLKDGAAEPCRDYAGVVATDNYAGGRRGGRRLGEVLGGRGRVAMLRCMVGFVSTAEREQGFLDAIREEFPDIQVVSSDQYGGATSEAAFARAESLLGRFPDLDGVFCPNESTTFGMLLALRDAGRAGRVRFVGFDSSEKLVGALAAREIDGLVLQDPVNIGYTSVRLLVDHLRGRAVPSRIDTGSTVATADNMNEPAVRARLQPGLGQEAH